MNFFFELKNRLLFILFSVLITTLAAVNYKEFIIYSITIPIIESQKDIQNIYFIYTNLTDIFDAYIKIFLLVAFQSFIFACSYQIFSFLTPALYKTEHKIFKNMLWVTTLSVNITHLLLCKIIIPLTIIFFENLQYNEAVSFKAARGGYHLVDSYQSCKGSPVIDGCCACVKRFFCSTVAE